MVGTATSAKNIFRVVEHIQLSEIQYQAHGYFGLPEIGIVDDPLTSPFTLSHITHLFDGYSTQATGI